MKIHTLQSRFLIAAISVAVLAIPFIVSAETVVRTGHSVSVSANQTVENDFYAAGSNVTHSGEVKEDLYAVAGTVTINGPVGNDLTVVGGTVQVHAPVEDDVRVIGGDVVIAGEVKGDVFVLGGLLRVLSSATVDGNIYFYGGEADIEGVVEGVVMGQAESFSINSEVGGIDVSAVRMELKDRAIVAGDVRYAGVSEIERATGAVVEGEVIHSPETKAADGTNGAGLVFAAAWIFTTLCFFLLIRPQAEQLLLEIRREPLRVGLVGLAAMVGAPVLSFVLLATVLGAWIGLVLLLLTILLFILGAVLMPILLGGYLTGLLFKGRRLDMLSVAMGLAAILLLSYIPVIGSIIIAAAFLLALGTLLFGVYKRGRNLI